MVGEWVGVGLAGALLAFGLLQYLFITLSNASTYDRLFRVPKHTHLVLPYCLNYFVRSPPLPSPLNSSLLDTRVLYNEREHDESVIDDR